MAHRIMAQDHIPCSFAYKVVCVDNNFSKKAVLYIGSILLIDLLNQFLTSITIAKNDKKAF